LTPDLVVPPHYYRNATLSRHQRRRHSAILRCLANLPGQTLDYGCGYGDLTFAISRTHSVFGTDTDANRIAFARSQYPDLQFSVCQPYEPPFGPDSFDLVASVVVLNFVEDAERYLSGIHSMLRPGGHLVLACKRDNPIRNLARRWFLRRPVEPRTRVRGKPEVQRLLCDSGFAVVKDDYFFDPPFEGWKNIGDVIFGVLEQSAMILRIRAAAGYFILIAQKPNDATRNLPSRSMEEPQGMVSGTID
jgi:SAM-dependent methyltransferase